MNRRESIKAVAAALLVGVTAPPVANDTEPYLRETLVWRDGKWKATRMRGLKPGEIFCLREGDGSYVEDSYWKAVSKSSPQPPPVCCMVDAEFVAKIEWPK